MTAARAQYAPTEHPESRGGLIAAVVPSSPADRAGLLAGDRVVAVDGSAVDDVVDWQWYTDSDAVTLSVVSSSGDARSVNLQREPGTPWGIDFADAVFDGIRTCGNTCVFCFMTQLPGGMRKALYLRDDDFRLSFLQGNFVTLTNLSDADVVRISEQHLSPLYVSVHAVEPDVRGSLVCAREDRALERIDQLLDEGIDLHAQIVLVPGVNDAEHLDRSLTWLAEREGIVSVGIVPLGYTRHQERFSASYNDPVSAAMVIQQVQRWQFGSRERDGVTWVHLADEFYLNAKAPFPTAEWYDDYPQYENGIGLVRSLADEVGALREPLTEAVRALPAESEAVTIVTGVMAATTIAGALNACDAAGRVRLLAVPNRFFGGNVGVTGLLTGADLVSAVTADRGSSRRPSAYIVPDVILNADGLTLDDMSVEDLRRASGADLRVVSCDAAGLLDGLIGVARNPPAQA